MKKTYFLLITAFLLSACGAESTINAEATFTPTVELASITSTFTPVPTPVPATETASPTPQPTLQPSIRISPNDGMTQLFVPAGSVHMGGLDIFAENDEKPPHIVRLNAFWIDQVEVTNGMYGLCVQAGVCKSPVKVNSDNRFDYFYNPEFRDYPVVYVTWLDARTYCEWAGRRLPTEAEWERAARGDDMRTYPWGDEPPNSELVNFNNSVGDTSRVGSYAEGASPFGGLDMAGNVWEWVADFYEVEYYAESIGTNPTGPVERIGRTNRVIRGGSFQDSMLNMRVPNRGYALGPDPDAQVFNTAFPGFSSVKIGFRCAADN
jgi:formylglycine-generating enzyme required for sulfatase activity